MTDSPTEKNYFFEDFQIDSSRKLLLRLPAGEAVALTRKAFQVLLLLVENCGKLVTKDDLMANVWQDSFVEEANLTQTISVLRKILGENPNQHRFIVTETGKGYRFVAPVKELNGGELTNQADFEEKAIVELSKETAAGQKSNYRKPFIYAFAGILAVFLLSGVYYFWKSNEAQIFQPSSTKEVKAIAVLPFKNIESDKENQLLGIGMADAVITKL